MTNPNPLIRAAFGAALAAMVPLAATHATQFPDSTKELILTKLANDTGAAERIEVADLMVTLSQEAASAACHYHNAIAPEESKKLLHEAHDDFAVYLDALTNGSAELHIIGKEERRKTLVDIERVAGIWAPISHAIEVLLEDPSDKDAVSLIKAENIKLLDATAHLLSEMEGEYSNPFELLQVDAMMIQFSGRQAMLAQKMAKESCQIWTGNTSQDLKDILKSTMGLFEATLLALHDGMSAVGLPPAPTPEIRTALETEVARWQTNKAELMVILESNDISEEAKTQVYHDLNMAMYALEEITHLYVLYAKHNYTTEDAAPAN